jgi:hypothetical protein
MKLGKLTPLGGFSPPSSDFLFFGERVKMSRKTQKILTKNLTRFYLLCTSTENGKVENLKKNSSGKPLQKNDNF